MFYKRKHFLINRKFQLKFAFFVCSWIFALSMIYPFIIYNVFEYFLHLAQTMGGAAAQLSVERVKGLQADLLFWLGVLQLIFLVITFILSIFLSHRIAGPLYKLRKSIEDLGNGEFDQRITFRKNDHFLELQDTFNDAAQKLSVKRWR